MTANVISIFSRVSFAPSKTDKVKEGLLVVCQFSFHTGSVGKDPLYYHTQNQQEQESNK